MTRLFPAMVIVVCALCAPTLAAPISSFDVHVDFESAALGPLPLDTGYTYTDLATGLKITFNRVSELFPLAQLPLEIVDLGDPSYGFGPRSLSPFANTNANEIAGYLRITIDTGGLLPGLELWRMDWDMGDFVPSDNDDLWLWVKSDAGIASKYLQYNNSVYLPPWGSQTYALVQSTNIQEIRMFAGTTDAPNSVFYDNFVFSLYDVAGEHYTAAEETPISSLGGDSGTGSLTLTDGDSSGGTPTAVPIPEPGSFFAMALGLAALGAGTRRRRRRNG